jgi:hypothetical protein
MTTDSQDSTPQPEPSPAPLPVTLMYGTPGSMRPAIISVVSVLGICIASLGLIGAAYGAFMAAVSGILMGRAMPIRWMTPAATAVSAFDAVVSAALAVALMSGSIGLLGLRSWSRRLLNSWAWIYLLSIFILLPLQILIVVPSQTNMVTNMFRSMPPPASTTTTTVGGVTTFNYSYTATSTTTGTAIGPGSAQSMALMRITYIVMAVGKSAICLIFPIVMLIVMRLQSVRLALEGDGGV